jgi:hypothetical protein
MPTPVFLWTVSTERDAGKEKLPGSVLIADGFRGLHHRIFHPLLAGVLLPAQVQRARKLGHMPTILRANNECTQVHCRVPTRPRKTVMEARGRV